MLLKKIKDTGTISRVSGVIAQLGERYDGIVEVRSSILLGSTKIFLGFLSPTIPGNFIQKANSKQAVETSCDDSKFCVIKQLCMADYDGDYVNEPSEVIAENLSGTKLCNPSLDRKGKL